MYILHHRSQKAFPNPFKQSFACRESLGYEEYHEPSETSRKPVSEQMANKQPRREQDKPRKSGSTKGATMNSKTFRETGRRSWMGMPQKRWSVGWHAHRPSPIAHLNPQEETEESVSSRPYQLLPPVITSVTRCQAKQPRNYIVVDIGTYLKPEARSDLIEAVQQIPSHVISEARTVNLSNQSFYNRSLQMKVQI